MKVMRFSHNAIYGLWGSWNIFNCCVWTMGVMDISWNAVSGILGLWEFLLSLFLFYGGCRNYENVVECCFCSMGFILISLIVDSLLWGFRKSLQIFSKLRPGVMRFSDDAI